MKIDIIGDIMDARNTAQGNTVIQGNTYYQKKTGVWFYYMNQVYPFIKVVFIVIFYCTLNQFF